MSAMVTCRTEQSRLLGTVATCTLHRCFPKSYHLSRLLYSAQRAFVSPKFHALAPGIFSLSSAHDLYEVLGSGPGLAPSAHSACTLVSLPHTVPRFTEWLLPGSDFGTSALQCPSLLNPGALKHLPAFFPFPVVRLPPRRSLSSGPL